MKGYTRVASKGKQKVGTDKNFTRKKGYKYLVDDSAKDGEWDRWRGQAQDTHVMLKQGPEIDILRYVQRMENCACSLIYALEADSVGEIKQRLRQVQFCKFRHCAVCQARRSRRNYIKFLKYLAQLMQDHLGMRFVFLTLTVPNVPITQLHDELVSMSKAWNRLLLRKEFQHVLGWVKSVEITKDRKRLDYAHPHFHVLLMVKSTYFARDNYVSRNQWRDAWRSCKRDESIVAVDVRIADFYQGKRLHGYDLVKSVSELLKYSVKPSDMLQDRAWLVELIRQVYKMRFLAAGGLLKSVFAEKMTNQEMIHVEEGTMDPSEVTEIAQLRYWWRPLEKRYSRRVKQTET